MNFSAKIIIILCFLFIVFPVKISAQNIDDEKLENIRTEYNNIIDPKIISTPSTTCLRTFQNDLSSSGMNLNKFIGGGVDQNLPNGVFTSLLTTLNTAIAGFPEPVGKTPTGQDIYNRGAIGSTGLLISTLIDQPPISTKEYLADLGSSLGVVKKAYAQDTGNKGFGWQVLTPVLNLWKAFRNVSYLIFVLIFIIIGFMIMFRTKINPQTVISIEMAIPNLIVTLILITFSYAIASLMIDLIYLLIYLSVGIFASGGIFSNQNQAINNFLNESVLWMIFSTGAGKQAGFAIGDIAASFLGSHHLTNTEGLSTISIIQSNFADFLGDSIVSGVAFLVLAVAMLFAAFKIFFQLLMAYVGIIISVIISPLQLLFNALPGSNSFTNWIKGLLANILIFPATATMFLLAAVLATASGERDANWGINQNVGFVAQNNNPWVPPLLFASINANSVAALMSFGILMMIPKVNSMIKEMLKVEKGAGLGAAIAPIAAVTSLPIAGVNQLVQFAQARQYIFPHKEATEYGGYNAPPKKD